MTFAKVTAMAGAGCDGFGCVDGSTGASSVSKLTSSGYKFGTTPTATQLAIVLSAAHQFSQPQFKAAMNQDGKLITTTKRVDVGAGNTAHVYLKFTDLNQNVERDLPPAKPAERKDIPESRKLIRP